MIKGPTVISRIGFSTKKPMMACLYQMGEGPKKLCQNACRADSSIAKPCFVMDGCWYYVSYCQNDDGNEAKR